MGKPINFSISKEMPGQTQESVEYTPPQGSRVRISKFTADGAFSKNSIVKLIWNYDHLSEPEEVIWAMTGSSSMPFTKVVNKRDIDGIRKLALVIDNPDTGPIFLSAHIIIEDS